MQLELKVNSIEGFLQKRDHALQQLSCSAPCFQQVLYRAGIIIDGGETNGFSAAHKIFTSKVCGGKQKL